MTATASYQFLYCGNEFVTVQSARFISVQNLVAKWSSTEPLCDVVAALVLKHMISTTNMMCINTKDFDTLYQSILEERMPKGVSRGSEIEERTHQPLQPFP